MKFCVHCGAQVHDDAVICVTCGRSITPANNQIVVNTKDDTMEIVIKVFMIIGCLSMGWLLVPLLWCIPMTVSVFNSLNSNRPISTGMKICVLLFVSLIAGVCMLCIDDNKL